MESERELCAKKAKLCEHSERYEDMKEAMKNLIVNGGNEPLSNEERNLLSVAYKNVVGARRSSWRAMHAREQEESNEGNKKLIRDYIVTIENELNNYCDEVISLLDDHLLNYVKDDAAAEIFFRKMKGDYYRYKVEIAEGEKKAQFASKSEEAYEEAMQKAEGLNPTHPIRLGLALNFSVFHYEIKNEPSEACKLAKDAFEKAIGELDNVGDETYKDSTLIMQLLRDNLTLWTTEMENEQEQQD